MIVNNQVRFLFNGEKKKITWILFFKWPNVNITFWMLSICTEWRFIQLITYLICHYVRFLRFTIKLFTARSFRCSDLFSPQGGSIRLWLRDQMQTKQNGQATTRLNHGFLIWHAKFKLDTVGQNLDPFIYILHSLYKCSARIAMASILHRNPHKRRTMDGHVLLDQHQTHNF